jgi:rhodanese-related sulfurtransferase
MLDKDMVAKELSQLIDIRTEFLDYLDENIPKKSNNIEFDFENNPTLNAQKIHEHFFKLDYQARKLRGFLVGELGIEVE